MERNQTRPMSWTWAAATHTLKTAYPLQYVLERGNHFFIPKLRDSVWGRRAGSAAFTFLYIYLSWLERVS